MLLRVVAPEFETHQIRVEREFEDLHLLAYPAPLAPASGVFKAIVDSNRQQMESYVELIQNVTASVDGFAEVNLGQDNVLQWLVDTFPASFEVQGGADADTAPEDRAEKN